MCTQAMPVVKIRAPETTPGPVTTADIVQEITTTEAASLTDSPETTPSPVTTEEMMNETANSGARRFMDLEDELVSELFDSQYDGTAKTIKRSHLLKFRLETYFT
ncbi:hypothetical protein SprV_0602103100 [Sparganum proliferum]